MLLCVPVNVVAHRTACDVLIGDARFLFSLVDREALRHRTHENIKIGDDRVGPCHVQSWASRVQAKKCVETVHHRHFRLRTSYRWSFLLYLFGSSATVLGSISIRNASGYDVCVGWTFWTNTFVRAVRGTRTRCSTRASPISGRREIAIRLNRLASGAQPRGAWHRAAAAAAPSGSCGWPPRTLMWFAFRFSSFFPFFFPFFGATCWKVNSEKTFRFA